MPFWLLVVIGLCGSAAAQTSADWLATLRTEVVGQGVSPETFDRFLNDFTPLKRVLELQNRQPEHTQTFDQYLRTVLDKRTATGRRLLAENRPLLDKISARYGVEPQYIVALWGIESSFGNYMGTTPTVAALATLAYGGRRKAYFRSELIEALRIADEGHVEAEDMQGSWAGAMGQCQFMPSSFRRLAVDYDGDGRRDIWSSRGDVFASIANYLAKNGWRRGQLWGREARIPASLPAYLVGSDVKMRLPRWQKLGVRKADGSDLPTQRMWGSLIRGDGDSGRSFLVYDNYHTFLRWNNSTFFALSAGMLADRLLD